MVKKRQIQSVEDESSPKVWYETAIKNGQPEILEDRDGGLSTTITGTATVPNFADISSPAKQPISMDVSYAVTADGKFIAYDSDADVSDHGVNLRAQLAWYDSDADEFTVLEFVE